MKASELITKLQELIDKHGDLDIYYNYDGKWLAIRDIHSHEDDNEYLLPRPKEGFYINPFGGW